MPGDGYRCYSQYSRSHQNAVIQICSNISSDEDMDLDQNDHTSDEVNRAGSHLQNEMSDHWSDCNSEIDELRNRTDPDVSVCDDDNDSQHSFNNSVSDAAPEEALATDVESNQDDSGDSAGEDDASLLYHGARITTSESMIALLSLSLRHKMSGALVNDLLELISLHCPEDNNCKTTLYTFKKFFSNMKITPIRHFYCTNCFERVESQNSICETCLERTMISYFIELPIIAQIKALYKRPGFYELLQHRFTRRRENLESLEDIYDGRVYNDLIQPGHFLSNCNNFSLTWYTDGIRIFQSSKFNIWPVYFVINELPPSERTKKENVLFVGVWFGDSKPIPNIFLEPLERSVLELRQGVNVQIHSINDPVTVKAIIICGTCDLPAKAMFLNMTQYNGRFGCQKCKQEGLFLNDARVRVYPDEPFDLRTDEETRVHARRAVTAGFAVCGVKGPSILSVIVHQSMRAIAIDVMHCVFEGVVKFLLNAWFSPSFSNHPSSLIRRIDLVSQRLIALTPPSSVQRLPRSIKDHLAYWKAHEYKNWFFYYSIPCISDIMREDYFDHYKLLVLGISLLSQTSIHPSSLDIASRALKEFVSRFEYMYSLRYMSNNIHQLLHLAENVRQFGPLWTTSCFRYEDLNGVLKRLVRGSNAAQLQIVSAISLYMNLTILTSQELVEGRLATEFCKNLEYKRGRVKRYLISDSTYIVGKFTVLQHLPAQIQRIFKPAGMPGTKYLYFQRLLKGKVMYSSTEYTRSKRTNSTYAVYSDVNGLSQIGRIRCFLRISDCFCRELCHCQAYDYAILRPCLCENEFHTCIDDTVLSTVHSVTDLHNVELAIEIASLKSVCFYCFIEDFAKAYVIEPVNLQEFE